MVEIQTSYGNHRGYWGYRRYDISRLFENGRFTSMFGYFDKENDETSNLWDPNFRQNQNGEFIQKVEFNL